MLLVGQWWQPTELTGTEPPVTVFPDVPPGSLVGYDPTEIRSTGTIAWATEGMRVRVDLSDRQVFLYEGETQVAVYAIAVGQPGWDTPTGLFEVIQMYRNPIWRHPLTKEIVPPGASNPLGSRWIGFWSNGEYQIGFHGTNQPELLGQAISHGCIRLSNADIEALYRQIEPGTPILIEP